MWWKTKVRKIFQVKKLEISSIKPSNQRRKSYILKGYKINDLGLSIIKKGETFVNSTEWNIQYTRIQDLEGHVKTPEKDAWRVSSALNRLKQ